jgi:uncharacterized protein (TIGR02231 family)
MLEFVPSPLPYILGDNHMSVIRFAVLSVCTALYIAPTFAADVDADSRVTAATVYGGLAMVTRTATVNITPGDHTVVITGLPAGLVPNTLRAEGTATAPVTLGAVQSKMISSAELAAPRERELRGKLQDLQDARAMIVADQTALNARLAFLNKIGDTATARVNEDIKTTVTLKPDEWAAAAIKVSQTTADTQKELQGIAVKLRGMDEQIAAVQTDLNQIKTGARQTYTVNVPLTAKGDGTLTLNIQYQIHGANWVPLYDARLATKDQSLDITQYGEVRQTTGEDWTDAILVLSTAQPARGATPPDVYSQWVNIFDQNRGMLEMDSMATMGAADMAMPVLKPASAFGDKLNARGVAAPELMRADMQMATINAGGYVAEYRIPGTTTVTSDNTAKKVMIQKLKTTSTLVAQARPALDNNVYLIAKTKLGGDAPLLPGMVNLFRDNAFIGSASVPMLRPGEDTDLAFGIDDQIVMKRQTVADKRGESGVIATQTTLTRAYDTEFQNLHTFPVALEVLEGTPVSKDERVKIALDTKYTTPGFTDDYKKMTGIKLWSVEKLAPQAKHTIKVGYTVTWPKDLNVGGL